MTFAVKLSEDIMAEARMMSKALNRSVSGQIEHWARVGKIVEENPDLNHDFIKNLLIAQQQAQAGHLQPYGFDS